MKANNWKWLKSENESNHQAKAAYVESAHGGSESSNKTAGVMA